MSSHLNLEQSALGKPTQYKSSYDPHQLFPILRQIKRDEIGISGDLPFFGVDLWNHYEVSWLNEKGKPIVAVAEINYGCDTPCIIESKSMKLYFNSLNNTSFKDVEAVQTIVKRDIEARVGGMTVVKITPLDQMQEDQLCEKLKGVCIDTLDIDCVTYQVEPAFLTTQDEIIEETLYSDLLKSNCLATNQPDWGSVQIIYKGKKINREGLLRYIVSFRNHNEFHEQCIERIFMDIMRCCEPETLTVYGRYTRRGGLDINPYRSTQKMQADTVENLRLIRQ